MKIKVDANAVCQKADVVLDLVHRAACLPPALSLTIEELLEGAWEIAYRPGGPPQRGMLIDLQAAIEKRQHARAQPHDPAQPPEPIRLPSL